ncbi:MAG TPA: triose-phosphate isomerase [Rhodospirillaceae bacterium]|jgi:triosephosphate isomerase|nr:triose-phosphate isomerase [Alphaproteobacteria bacterium]HBH26877.1 triose-phosphate isomerase [Rhodospirillaceae bacterium]
MQALIAGNWKMHPSCPTEAAALARAVAEKAGQGLGWVVFPPFPLLTGVHEALAGSCVEMGGQDCSTHEAGAHTGQVSAVMLRALGCSYVLIGHSERRALGEHSAVLKAKIRRALAAGLTPVLCVGESAKERRAGRAEAAVAAQLTECMPADMSDEREIVVAYEPLWAIGTGAVPEIADIQDMHSVLKGQTKGRVLYGGSVAPGNAAAILATPGVDGVLVGGASLDPSKFLAIGAAAC